MRDATSVFLEYESPSIIIAGMSPRQYIMVSPVVTTESDLDVETEDFIIDMD